MSDHEEIVPDTGYDTPVPELDDHRHQSASSQRMERPRRGTFDSLYGARQGEADEGIPAIRVRDFEEAIIDEDFGEMSPSARRPRRGTFDSNLESRGLSPPNSVKAFAEARRRERGASFTDTKAEQEDNLSRAMSISSRRSRRSGGRQTIDNDGGSILTNKTAEDDVCFPLQNNHRKNQLHIDFDFLESFINAERELHVATRMNSVSASFRDLRSPSADARATQLPTIDGDILEMPSDESMENEKNRDDTETAALKQAVQPNDVNRFSFFSSAWESTIHAAEMGDLVLPGEDIRGLFELPEEERDGVWWLNVNSATKDEVQGICKAFGVHPLTIEDIITQEAREKIELFPSYYFACFRSFSVVEEPEGKEFEPFNIYVVVFREGTLSFSFTPNSHASQVRKRITALKDYVSLSSDWICYALM